MSSKSPPPLPGSTYGIEAFVTLHQGCVVTGGDRRSGGGSPGRRRKADGEGEGGVPVAAAWLSWGRALREGTVVRRESSGEDETDAAAVGRARDSMPETSLGIEARAPSAGGRG